MMSTQNGLKEIGGSKFEYGAKNLQIIVLKTMKTQMNCIATNNKTLLMFQTRLNNSYMETAFHR